jgi:hypothetical protein
MCLQVLKVRLVALPIRGVVTPPTGAHCMQSFWKPAKLSPEEVEAIAIPEAVLASPAKNR